MLQNPSIKQWLGGIDPVWTLLDAVIEIVAYAHLKNRA
jgi:hypothetical protein